jgi:hypothetical protein
MFIPNMILGLFASIGAWIASLLGTLLYCIGAGIAMVAILAIAASHGKAMVVLVLVIFVTSTIMHQLPSLVAVCMCPFQLGGGVYTGLAESALYWKAAFTLSWAPGADTSGHEEL